MFKHYLATALRNFRRHWVTTSVNVIGLTLGLACFIGALNVIHYFKLDDKQYPGSDRTYFIAQQYLLNQSAATPMVYTGVPWIVAEHLKSALPALEYVSRVVDNGKTPIVVTGDPSDIRASFADADFLKIFPIPFVMGDRNAALTRPRSAIITATMAIRLFGTTAVMGRTILLYGSEPVTITGVFTVPVEPSHLIESIDSSTERFELLLSMDMLLTVQARESSIETATKQLRGWGTGKTAATYARLPDNGAVSATTLNSRLDKLASEHASEGIPRKLSARPIAEFRQTGLDNLAERATTGLSWSSLLMLVSGLILFISCLNYANLATAITASHRRELGIRRALGASTQQLIVQQLIDALILVSIAMLLALAALLLVNPIVRNARLMDLLYVWSHSVSFWKQVTIMFVLVTMTASVLPILSTLRTRLATALAHSRSGANQTASARWLVSAQFFLAGLLLIFLSVVRSQQQELVAHAHSSLKDPIIAIQNYLRGTGADYAVLRTELLRQPHVVSVSASSFSPWGRSYGLISLASSNEASATDINVISEYVTHDYFSNLKISVLAGMGFSDSDPSVTSEQRTEYPIVLDQTAARQLGFDHPQDAIGKTVYPGLALRRSNPSLRLQVIGVVEDRLMQFTTSGATSTVYLSNARSARTPLVRLSKGHEAAGLAEIRTVWKRLAPNFALRAEFIDEIIDTYANDTRVYTTALSWLTLLAFTISLSGLIGMSIHMANRRTHEIGVRKTLGARTGQIVSLLLRDFSRPVIIGNLLAWPLAYLIARTYLDVYVHRIALTPTIFVMSLAIAVGIACTAVGWHAVRAARLNPATVLRHE